MPRLAPSTAIPAVRLVATEKSFGPIRALRPVSLDVPAGTIHALVGQNGAGKSTTLGILAGRVSATAGRVEVFGAPVVLGDPRAARAAGIVAIYQELTIVPALSAVANVFLGQTLSKRGILSEAIMRRRFQEHCSRLGVAIPPDVPAGRLSVADQQTLEIMRALQAEARVILFDEPTTALAPPEREALLQVMRDLRAAGQTLLYVSHNLDEVLGISDAVTVFRNGTLIETRPTEGWTKAGLVTAMLGADLGDLYHRRPPTRPASPRPTLEVESVSLPGAIEGVSFAVAGGEILGIGGLVGSGRTSVLRCLAGLEPTSSGTIRIRGQVAPWPRTPRQSRALGIALVPEDRKEQGLVLGRPVTENVTLPNMRRTSRLSMVDGVSMRAAAASATRAFGFDPARLDALVGTLSGGNQQKVLLARWAFERPRVLLVDEPTRGIDVGAKAEILDSLRAFADEGVAVVIVSSELEELTALADRVMVLSEGRKVDELDASRARVTVQGILNSAFGVERSFHG